MLRLNWILQHRGFVKMRPHKRGVDEWYRGIDETKITRHMLNGVRVVDITRHNSPTETYKADDSFLREKLLSLTVPDLVMTMSKAIRVGLPK